MISVVVPTYNEAGSVPKLAERLHAALSARDWAEISTLAGNGGEQVLVDSQPAISQRFYRVRIE